MGTKTENQNAAWLLKPADSDSLNQADDEIRSTRKAQQERLAEEHVNLVTTLTNDQGVHKPGSAIIYTGTSFPTKRPDGVTSFTTALDKGREFLNTSTGVKYVLLTADGADNNVWGAVTAASSFGDFAVGGDLNVATDGVIGRDLTVTRNLSVGGKTPYYYDTYVGFNTSNTEDQVFDYFDALVPTQYNTVPMVTGRLTLFSLNRSYHIIGVHRYSSTRIDITYAKPVTPTQSVALETLSFTSGSATSLIYILDIYYRATYL
jgi:hypothetical protein